MISNKTTINFETTIVLKESEARALEALSCYGIDPFLDAFYKSLGMTYLKPHEDGLRSLLYRARNEILPELSRIDDARKILATDERGIRR